MKILLVEDQAEKQAGVCNYVETRYPDAEIEIADSYYSAKKSLLMHDYAIVLLDMSLPIYQSDNGQISSVLVYGGEDLLHWAKRRIRDLKVIVITQFDMFPEEGRSRNLAELTAGLQSEFGETLLGVVRYNESDVTWQAELSRFFDKIL